MIEYFNGQEVGFYMMLEILGGGVVIFDIDFDGSQDLWFLGGGMIVDGE